MTLYIFIVMVLVLFGIFVPVTVGAKWHPQYKKGYRSAMIMGATAVVLTAAVLHLYFKIF